MMETGETHFELVFAGFGRGRRVEEVDGEDLENGE